MWRSRWCSPSRRAAISSSSTVRPLSPNFSKEPTWVISFTFTHTWLAIFTTCVSQKYFKQFNRLTIFTKLFQGAYLGCMYASGHQSCKMSNSSQQIFQTKLYPKKASALFATIFALKNLNLEFTTTTKKTLKSMNFQYHQLTWPSSFLSSSSKSLTWPASFSTSSLSRPKAAFSSFTCLLFTTCSTMMMMMMMTMMLFKMMMAMVIVRITMMTMMVYLTYFPPSQRCASPVSWWLWFWQWLWW